MSAVHAWIYYICMTSNYIAARWLWWKTPLVVGVKITLMQPIQTSFGDILLSLTAICIYVYVCDKFIGAKEAKYVIFTARGVEGKTWESESMPLFPTHACQCSTSNAMEWCEAALGTLWYMVWDSLINRSNVAAVSDFQALLLVGWGCTISSVTRESNEDWSFDLAWRYSFSSDCAP